jgi:hypothetical protein
LEQFVDKNLPISKPRAHLSETRQVFSLKLGRKNALKITKKAGSEHEAK